MVLKPHGPHRVHPINPRQSSPSFAGRPLGRMRQVAAKLLERQVGLLKCVPGGARDGGGRPAGRPRRPRRPRRPQSPLQLLLLPQSRLLKADSRATVSQYVQDWVLGVCAPPGPPALAPRAWPACLACPAVRPAPTHPTRLSYRNRPSQKQILSSGQILCPWINYLNLNDHSVQPVTIHTTPAGISVPTAQGIRFHYFSPCAVTYLKKWCCCCRVLLSGARDYTPPRARA